MDKQQPTPGAAPAAGGSPVFSHKGQPAAKGRRAHEQKDSGQDQSQRPPNQAEPDGEGQKGK